MRYGEVFVSSITVALPKIALSMTAAAPALLKMAFTRFTSQSTLVLEMFGVVYAQTTTVDSDRYP